MAQNGCWFPTLTRGRRTPAEEERTGSCPAARGILPRARKDEKVKFFFRFCLRRAKPCNRETDRQLDGPGDRRNFFLHTSARPLKSCGEIRGAAQRPHRPRDFPHGVLRTCRAVGAESYLRKQANRAQCWYALWDETRPPRTIHARFPGAAREVGFAVDTPPGACYLLKFRQQS